jgi:chromosome segregation ATPase
MTPTTRSLLAAAVLVFVASPAFAECDMVVFPETHIGKDATAEQLRTVGTSIQQANAKLEKYNACIDKMIKDKMPADATKDQIAAHEAEINKHTDAYNKALDNLSKAATEYNEAVKAYKARSQG